MNADRSIATITRQQYRHWSSIDLRSSQPNRAMRRLQYVACSLLFSLHVIAIYYCDTDSKLVFYFIVPWRI